MLELKTKWMSNSLAKESMLKNDFILCHNGSRLFIIGYGALTSSGKNTYNYEVKDNEKNIILSSGNNAYLDALTKIILGTSPKAKANKDKETSEATKETKKQTKESAKEANECLLLTFDKAFDKSCKMLESYKDIAIMLGKYDANDSINLALYLIKEANESEAQRIKDAKKQSELQALQGTLEIAIAQNNTMLVDAIKEMIAKKENE